MRHFSATVLVAVVLLANVEWAISKLITDYPIVNHDPIGHQYGATPKRLLRRFDEDTEERTIGGGALSGLTTKLKSDVSKLTEKVKNLNKYDNELAVKFKLANRDIDKILTSANLKKVTEQVKKANAKNIFKKATVIGTLTAGYGDDVLAKAIATIEQKAILEGNSILKQQMRALRQDQLMRWKDGGNSADDVFKLLKAENVRDDSRMFLVLDDYVKLVNRKKSDPGETLLNTLMKGFKNDEKVGALLYAAKKEPDTMEKALQLENSLLKQWAADRQVPANVFQWLRFDHDVHYAFKADNFKRIVKYADDFKKQEPTFKTSTVELFTNRFPGDVVANKLIRISTMYDTTISSAAKKLQTEQLLSWKSSGKSGDEVVDMFKISTLEPSAITSRKLDAVDEFLKLTGAEQDLIAILTIKFGRLNLARILQSASPTTNITPYQAKQFAAWVKQGITPRNFATALFKKNTELAIENKFKAFYKARQLK